MKFTAVFLLAAFAAVASAGSYGNYGDCGSDYHACCDSQENNPDSAGDCPGSGGDWFCTGRTHWNAGTCIPI